jgi:hypothetical protein
MWTLQNRSLAKVIVPLKKMRRGCEAKNLSAIGPIKIHTRSKRKRQNHQELQKPTFRTTC